MRHSKYEINPEITIHRWFLDTSSEVLGEAYSQGSGPRLAATLLPAATAEDPDRLRRIFQSSNILAVSTHLRSGLLAYSNHQVKLSKAEISSWIEVYSAYWNAIGEVIALEDHVKNDHSILYEAWRDVVIALIKGYSSGQFEAWTIPCLYVAGRYLRIFAIKSDEYGSSNQRIAFHPSNKEDIASDLARNEKLEDAARVINRVFTICISDRAPIEASRKWGLYHTTNLLFKTYFKLNSIALSKNIIRALQASQADMPNIDAFPKSHVVTFEYYVGVILFLEENYENAEEHLTKAWNICHRSSMRNKELILTYLVPCNLLTRHTLPTRALLAPYPRLQVLFGPLCRCIKIGDLAGFDAALAAGEDEFVKRRIYLTLERGRDVALRNLLRKVYLAGGFEAQIDGVAPIRRTRIPLVEFVVAIRIRSSMQGEHLNDDEVECMLANMIYKNLVKGYISRERRVVVLSKGSAFPGTGV